LELFEWLTLIGVFATFLLLLTIVAVLRRFFTLISPLLEKFTSPGGQMKIPSIRDLIGLAGLKLMEQMDWSKIAGSLTGGMMGAKK